MDIETIIHKTLCQESSCHSTSAFGQMLAKRAATIHNALVDPDNELTIFGLTPKQIAEQSAEITRLRARLAEAEKVIKPFADQSCYIWPEDADECLVAKAISAHILCIGHLRAAAEWMKENKP